MNAKLASFTFSGIKNIEKPITFNFINKTAKNTTYEELGEFKIKGVYGPNGVGKTALVEAISLYKLIASDADGLVKENRNILQLLNSKSNKFKCTVTFYISDPKLAKKTYKYCHDVEVSNTDGRLTIINENLQIDKKYIYRLEKGEFVEDNLSSKFKSKVVNTLSNSTFTGKIVDLLSSNQLGYEFFEEFSNIEFTEWSKIIRYLMCVVQLKVYYEEKDDHANYLYTNELNNLDKLFTAFKITTDDLGIAMRKSNCPQLTKRMIVSSEEVGIIESDLVNLTKFLKIFKPQLIDLELKQRPIDEKAEIEVIANYPNNSVSMEFESVGIKKLVETFYMVRQLGDNSIVIYDEIDAHLHDVALTELLCYIDEQNKGQLVFTCHNLNTMDVLDGVPNSIDVITLEGEVKTWKTRGNAVARNSYKNGFMTNDFGYSMFDFWEVFND